MDDNEFFKFRIQDSGDLFCTSFSKGGLDGYTFFDNVMEVEGVRIKKRYGPMLIPISKVKHIYVNTVKLDVQ